LIPLYYYDIIGLLFNGGYSMILERINGPEDIKKISEKELPTLAKEVRSALNS